MKQTLENIIAPLDGYLISIKRNVDNAMYELEVGFRKNWVYKSTDDIECDVTLESDNGSLVTISGKHDEITVDNLIEFVKKVIETNQKITEMEERFEEKLAEQRKSLEDEVYKFQNELEEFKSTSFDSSKTKEPKSTSKKKIKSETITDEELIQKIS